MAQARNYQVQEAGSSLDDDIERVREEFEVEICQSKVDPERDLHRRQTECKKNPGHVDFIPEPEFTIEHLPVEWRDPLVYKAIRATARRVVHLSVFYTSTERPDEDTFSGIRGKGLTRYGTGFAQFPSDYQNKQPQECPFQNCKVSHPHNVTPEFYVDTASYVVFDSNEAERTEIRFFIDSKDDTKGKAEITAQGLRIVESSASLGENSTFTCVSHNLNIRDLCESDTEEGGLEPTPRPFETDEKKPEPQFSPTGTKEKIPEQPSSFSSEEEKKLEPLINPNETEKKKPDSPLSSSNEEEKKPDQPLVPPHTEEKTHDPPLRDTNSKIRKPLVVIVSHPHGCSKHVSTEVWTGVDSMASHASKFFRGMAYRKHIELMRLFGIKPEIYDFMGLPPFTMSRQFFQKINAVIHDMFLINTCPFTLNEITHKMLLAMWEKTTSNSTLSGQVSEEELSEIALNAVTDILPFKSSQWKTKFSILSLNMWETVIFDSRFSRQLCKEEFDELCMHFVNDRFGTHSLTLKERFKQVCSLFTLPFGTTVKLFQSYFFNEGFRFEDEANPLRNMTIGQVAGQVAEDVVDKMLKNPNILEPDFKQMVYYSKTCPGSSGAPVLLFYDKDNGEVGFDVSMHCGANKGTNISSRDPFISSLFEKVKPTDKLKQEVSQDDIPLD